LRSTSVGEVAAAADLPDERRLARRIADAQQRHIRRMLEHLQADGILVDLHALPREVHLVEPLLQRQDPLLFD
jgi:hypothetical protein